MSVSEWHGLQGRLHFTEILTRKITGDVKLVGPNINCGGMKILGTDTPVSNPHVQSFTAATDAVGFDILRHNGSVFGCYDAVQDTVVHSELGASSAILHSGYNLDCLMVRIMHAHHAHVEMV